ncbi:hypothetical protein C8046_09360 [Serinibacter arcticus]|uniref:Uncharacterized protein n=1 Tax=Serinibacter arcticus TaxID=1655435 RepID=A0A2U1ZV18_9MICO|nr:LPXTG cell wall anchor domain-containing protein [Serinibacter arcticus]PWD50824.1 hypothetical protein C8046_09360 [Serinibacter arcticus]
MVTAAVLGLGLAPTVSAAPEVTPGAAAPSTGTASTDEGPSDPSISGPADPEPGALEPNEPDPAPPATPALDAVRSAPESTSENAPPVAGRIARTTPGAAISPMAADLPEPATAVFLEDFENGMTQAAGGAKVFGTVHGAGVQYTGAGGRTYTGSAEWIDAARCNGIVVGFNNGTATANGGTPTWASTPSNANRCSTAASVQSYNEARTLARAMGVLTGRGDGEHIVSSQRECNLVTATGLDTPLSCGVLGTNASGVVLQTTTPVALTTGRYYTYGVDTVVGDCPLLGLGTQPTFQFQAQPGATGAWANVGATLEGCSNPDRTISATRPVAVGLSSAMTVSGKQMTTTPAAAVTAANANLRLVSTVGSAGVTPAGFDNVRVLDATPSLDTSFSPTSVTNVGASTLTYTVTNTTELAAKNDFAFTNTLPTGLVVANPAAATSTCGNGTVTAAVGSGTVALAGGDLAAGQVSCTVTVRVTAPLTGTYTNGPANIATALVPAPAATLTVTVAQCAPANVWANSQTRLVELTPTGTVLRDLALTTVYGDLAWTSSGDQLVGVRFGSTPVLDFLTPGATSVTVSSSRTLTPAVASINGLSAFVRAGAPGFLLGAAGSSQIYFAPQAGTGTITLQNWGTFPGGGTSGGDFLTLPDGSVIGLAAVTGGTQVVRFPSTGGQGTGVGLVAGSVWGAALSGNDIILGLSDNTVRRLPLSSVPTAAGSSTLATTAVTLSPSNPFTGGIYGMGSKQDSGSCVREQYYTVAKTASPASGTPRLPGDTVTYTVTVRNTADVAYTTANPAAFVDDLSGVIGGATIGTPTVTGGGSAAYSATPTPRITWSGPLAIGATVTVTYTATVRNVGGGSLTNSVAATGAAGTCAAAPATCVTAHPITPTTLTVQKDVVGRGSPTDQFALRLAQGATTVATATTAGTANGIQVQQIAAQTVTPGATYSVSETMAAGSTFTLADYSSRYECRNAGGTLVASGAVRTFDVAVTAGQSWTCVIVNTPTGSLSLAKQLVGTPMPGAQVTYEITLTQTGAATVPVSLVDTFGNPTTGRSILDDAAVLPASVQVVPANAGVVATYDPAAGGGPVLRIAGAMAPLQAPVVVRYTVQINALAAIGDGVLANCVGTAPGAPGSVCTSSGIVAPVKTASPATGTVVAPGETVTYSLAFRSLGAAPTAIAFTDHLAGVQDDADIISGPTITSTGPPSAVTATPTPLTPTSTQLAVTGTVSAGGTVTVSYAVVVSPLASTGDGLLRNFLRRTADGPPGLAETCPPGGTLCTQHPVAALLTLVKSVSFGSAAPTSWTLTAAGAPANRPGPTGVTGTPATTAVPITPSSPYALGESGGPATYVGTGWTCVNGAGAAVPLVSGTITLPRATSATCTVTNATATITLLKHVVDPVAPFTAGAWDVTATPAAFAGPGTLPIETRDGAEQLPGGNPASTFEVRPGHGYALSEVLADPGSLLAYRQVGLEQLVGGTWQPVASADVTAPAAGQTAVYRFVNERIPGVELPITGGASTDAFRIAGALVLMTALLGAAWVRRRRRAMA